MAILGREQAEISKDEFENLEKDYQERLYLIQSEAASQKKAILILLDGFAGSGKGDVMKSITGRLDPRKVRVHSYEKGNLEYMNFGFHFEFWRKLPSYSQISIFDGSWYKKMVYERVLGDLSKKDFYKKLERTEKIERMLIKDRYFISKIFLHISSDFQKKKFKKAIESGKKWMVTEQDELEKENYKEFDKTYGKILDAYSETPWKIFRAEDKVLARKMILESLIGDLENFLGFDSDKMLQTMKDKEGAAA
ncbi:MAG TPA: hypothetical protein PK453_13195 [Leptospiraceae bacterium]|nr:hypothetical protein [Leptospiraceae bacterium]HNF14621.1 hypothetical protein [Leptospiraceae bacterium]HNF25184.1 hypothetical protein [Leptospiraceae bacterium]HNI96195.1 hypothetical protein [Leptospiraceae bacterium]HNM05730.1 hypothetical protein [Leptospiraceae bacterium]